MTALQVKAKKLILCLAVFYRQDFKGSLCASLCPVSHFAFLTAEFLQSCEDSAPTRSAGVPRGLRGRLVELRAVVHSAAGQHLREGRGSWGVHLGRGWGAQLGRPALTAPRARTHQRDPGPGSRRGAVEGRARGGRQSAGQQRPQAEEGRKRGGRRQPGSHQSPDGSHGRTETAGLKGHAAEGSRAERSLPRLRSRPVPVLILRAPRRAEPRLRSRQTPLLRSLRVLGRPDFSPRRFWGGPCPWALPRPPRPGATSSHGL